MYIEIPDCRRCCFCVPLRHGVLIFAYLKLFFNLLNLGVDIGLEIKYSSDPGNRNTVLLYRGVSMLVQMWLAYFLYVLETIFNIALIVGAHKKSVRIMRAYYYYGIVTTAASFVVFLVLRRHEKGQIYDPLEMCLAFSGIFLQCYLLLVIRAELKKLKYLAGPFRYVNQVADVTVEPLPPAAATNQV